MTDSNQENNLFPLFLKLEQFRVLIIGAGPIGLEKLTAVLSNSPATAITLIARTIHPGIYQLLQAYPNNKVEVLQRSFLESDLMDCDIVISAVNDKNLSREIHQQAKQLKRLINVADTPDLCDFYLSSIVRKGNLKIAISTNGKSPTLAKRLKELLNEVLPEELNSLMDNLSAIRNQLKGNFAEKVKHLNELTSILVSHSKK